MSSDGWVKPGIALPSTRTRMAGKAMAKKAPTGSRRKSLDSVMLSLMSAFTASAFTATVLKGVWVGRRTGWGVGERQHRVLERGPPAPGTRHPGDQSGRRVQRGDAAGMDDRDPVAEPLRLVHKMGYQD